MGERLLARKRALVVGLMNKHSIASSITQSLLSAGADVVVTSKSPLSERQIQACQFDVSHGSSLHFQACDVEKEEEIEILINNCSTIFDGKLDILVHSIAYAPPDTFKPLLSDDQKLTGGLLSVSKDAWNQAFNTSAYSLIGLTRAAYPLLINGDRTSSKSIVSLSYLGAEKVNKFTYH
jgi:enoyl-[acyl-carrier protein] reductase I